MRRVRAFVMTETLEAGSAVVEALGVHLDVQMAAYWQPDQTFFGLIRDGAVIHASYFTLPNSPQWSDRCQRKLVFLAPANWRHPLT